MAYFFIILFSDIKLVIWNKPQERIYTSEITKLQTGTHPHPLLPPPASFSIFISILLLWTHLVLRWKATKEQCSYVNFLNLTIPCSLLSFQRGLPSPKSKPLEAEPVSNNSPEQCSVLSFYFIYWLSSVRWNQKFLYRNFISKCSLLKIPAHLLTLFLRPCMHMCVYIRICVLCLCLCISVCTIK